MNAQVFTVSISPTTPSKSDAAGVPGILEELRQIKEQNLEILRLIGAAKVPKDRRWYGLQYAAERLDRSTWTLRQLCSHGKIRAEKGDDGQWRIAADELARLEQDGVPKLPQRSAK
jgi:hypothetical protein